MLAFRKLFLVLALVTLTVAVASAQPLFQCIANAGVPALVRSEGLAEMVGDMTLNCNNGTPTAMGTLVASKVNVQIFLNTNITSKLINSPGTEALLMIDDPQPSEQKICLFDAVACEVDGFAPYPGLVYKPHTEGTTARTPFNVWQGRKASDSSLVWLGVPIDAPGTVTPRIIRITNVRANASQLGSGGLVPQNILMYISITGTGYIQINNPTQTVAWIQSGMKFSVRKASDLDSTGTISINQCSGTNKDLFGNTTKTNACPNSVLRFDEGFGAAFKTRYSNDANGANPAVPLDQNIPGAPQSIYTKSESGFFVGVNTAWSGLAGLAGVASQGTRLRIVVNGVPAGVRVFVTTKNIGTSATAMNEARLVTVNADGSGVFSEPTALTTVASTCASVGATTGIVEIPLYGGTSGTAVWEIYTTNQLAILPMDFGLVLAAAPNTPNSLPALGTVTVNGMFAPFSTNGTMSSSAPVPRFVDNSSANNSAKIVQCVSNLLFPFVTNQAGFNTGMVIANTTNDIYDNNLESGTCSLNYFGNTNGGAAPPAQTTLSVAAGGHVAFDLLGGGTHGVLATPGFQGYVIAKCNFRFSHGYAFISDTSMARVANGYLALILDSHSNTRGTSGESLGQ